MGRAAYFIRTFGCPVKCAWCDAAGTWHPDYIPQTIERCMPGALVERALASDPEFVVITGGEPAIHDLTPLTRALHESGLQVHLETSGAFALKGAFDWVTVSPKWDAAPLAEVLAQADELKIIVESPRSIGGWLETIAPQLKPGCVVWLHPEWSQRENRAVLSAISQAVKTGWRSSDDRVRICPRAGWQLHKLYRVDAMDPHAQAPAPLGGDPALGY